MNGKNDPIEGKGTVPNSDGKKRKIITILVSVVAVLAVLGIINIARGWGRVSTDDAYIEGRIHTIAPKVAGTLLKINVEDNQAVKKGDPLVEIDPKDYEVRVNEAQAALEAEKARLVDAEAGIKAAEAILEVQKVALNQAELDKQRSEALFKENVVPKERNEKAATAYSMAESQVKAASEQMAKARSLKELEASMIKQREAALETARLNLGYTKITASSDGYVTKKAAEEGNQVQAGQPLMAIVALDDIWIVANYKETQLKNVRPGQRVDVEVDTFPGTVFRGKVDSIMAGTGSVFSLFPAENALGNYVKVVQRVPVKITVDKWADSRHILRIGMSCTPSIITSE